MYDLAAAALCSSLLVTSLLLKVLFVFTSPSCSLCGGMYGHLLSPVHLYNRGDAYVFFEARPVHSSIWLHALTV